MPIVFSLVLFMLAILAHAAVMRQNNSRNSVAVFLLSGTFFGVMLLIALFTYYGLDKKTITGIVIYMLLCELYIFIFTLVLSSISVSILIDLICPDKKLDKLDEKKLESMVDVRIERLIKNGFLERGHNGVYITKKGSKVVKLFESLKSFFRHQSN